MNWLTQWLNYGLAHGVTVGMADKEAVRTNAECVGVQDYEGALGCYQEKFLW